MLHKSGKWTVSFRSCQHGCANVFCKLGANIDFRHRKVGLFDQRGYWTSIESKQTTPLPGKITGLFGSIWPKHSHHFHWKKMHESNKSFGSSEVYANGTDEDVEQRNESQENKGLCWTLSYYPFYVLERNYKYKLVPCSILSCFSLTISYTMSLTTQSLHKMLASIYA